MIPLGLYLIRGDNMYAATAPSSASPRARAPVNRHRAPRRRLTGLLPPRVRGRPRSAVVGQVDEEIDAEIDLDSVRAEPLEPIVH